MNRIPFSVSMCVYGKNNPEHFRTAVESILHQTVKPDEIVLVVDGPVPDELNLVISAYEQQPVFNVIRLAENQGHGNARRMGLSKCSYELVALMDADDISVDNRFELQLAAFQDHPDVSVIGGNITEFSNDPTNIVGMRSVPQSDTEIKRYMKTRCPMNQITVMFRKQDVEAVGGYIDWYCEEDYYLWLRLMQAGYMFLNIDSALCHVRVGEEMYKRRGGWKYFKSEAKLQKYMIDNQIIPWTTYVNNVLKRLVVQVLLPNTIRGWVFKTFARENVK